MAENEEAKGKVELHKDAEAMRKLSAFPVKDVLNMGEEKVNVWIHPLTVMERNHVRASTSDAYRMWVDQGGEKETALLPVSGVMISMTVFFSLRLGDDKKSKRVFENQVDVIDFPVRAELNRLYETYCSNFVFTEKDWGNYLRARN